MLCWPFPMGIFSSESVWRHRAGTISIAGKNTWPLSLSYFLCLSLPPNVSLTLSPSLKGFVAFWKSHFCLCSGTHTNRCVATCRRTRKQSRYFTTPSHGLPNSKKMTSAVLVNILFGQYRVLDSADFLKFNKNVFSTFKGAKRAARFVVWSQIKGFSVVPELSVWYKAPW